MKVPIGTAVLCVLVGGSVAASPPVQTIPPPSPAVTNAADSARTILERYARAWRGKAAMELEEPVTVSFRIRGPAGGDYQILIPVDGPAVLRDGAPSPFTIGFETDIDFLRRLDRGELNAATAMAQAGDKDAIPLEPRFPEGFHWTPEARSFFLSFMFHFWNRERPVVIRFGDGTTRYVHGGNSAILYYGQGLRSSWYQLKAGMHINREPEQQGNPFDSVFICTRGAFQARLDGTERTMREGEAIFVPRGMRHEFWARPDQYGEFVLLMFGEGA